MGVLPFGGSAPSASGMSAGVGLGSRRTRPHEEALLAAVSSAGASVFSNPLDVARVRSQLQMEGQSAARGATRGLMSGPLHSVVHIARAEGAAALTRGLSAAMAYNVVLNGTRFSVFSLLTSSRSEPSDGLLRRWGSEGLSLPTVSGVLAGCAAGFLASPLAQVRTLQQGIVSPAQTTSSASSSSASASARGGRAGSGFILSVLRAQPFAGATCWSIRNGGHTSIIFSLYGYSRDRIHEWSPRLSAPALNLCATLFAATVSCVLMNPVDLVATRLFADAGRGKALQRGGVKAVGGVRAVAAFPQYTSAIDCALKTVVHEGVGGLYKGLGANIARIVPHTVLTFGLMEMLRSALVQKAAVASTCIVSTDGRGSNLSNLSNLRASTLRASTLGASNLGASNLGGRSEGGAYVRSTSEGSHGGVKGGSKLGGGKLSTWQTIDSRLTCV